MQEIHSRDQEIKPQSLDLQREQSTISAALPPSEILIDPSPEGLVYNDDHRYHAYQTWCKKIGLTAASFVNWERINRQVNEESWLTA